MTEQQIEPTEQEVKQPTLKRRIPVPFFTPIPANTTVCLVSDMINFPFIVSNIQSHFADNCLSNLQVWAFVSSNSNPSTVAPPPDNKLLGFYSPTPYHIGNGEIVDTPVHVKPAENEKYLKVYFSNANNYAVNGYCIITIQTDNLIGLGVYPVTNGELTPFSSLEDYKEKIDKESHAMYDQILDFESGTPAWLNVEDVTSARVRGETYKDWVAESDNVSLMSNFFKADMTESAFTQQLKVWSHLAMEVQHKHNTAMVIGDIAGLGKVQFTKYVVEADKEIYRIAQTFGRINETVYDVAMLEKVKQIANTKFTPVLPDTSELINMAVKEKIEVDDFKNLMMRQGYSKHWSQLIWDAHFTAPDFETIKRAYNRGFIPKTDLDKYLKLVDLDPFYNDVAWKPLLDEIPPYQELVNQRVKEVITQPQFEKGLEGWGYRGDIAKNIWDAHFTPPTYDDFLTAMRRQETVTFELADGTKVSHKFGEDITKDKDMIHQLSVLADYDPRYQSFFDTRMYEDVTPRMARWALETGSIDNEQLREIVHRYGYYPKDEEWFSDMLIHFQERSWVVRYLTALATAYVNEAITSDELKKRVTAIPRNIEIAEWMIKISDVRKEILASKKGSAGIKLLSSGDLKKAYIFGKIDEMQLRTELQLLGYESKDVELLIEMLNTEKDMVDSGGKKKGLTTAELMDAFRYSFITESELSTELQLRGMLLHDVDTLIKTKKAKWGVAS